MLLLFVNSFTAMVIDRRKENNKENKLIQLCDNTDAKAPCRCRQHYVDQWITLTNGTKTSVNFIEFRCEENLRNFTNYRCEQLIARMSLDRDSSDRPIEQTEIQYDAGCELRCKYENCELQNKTSATTRPPRNTNGSNRLIHKIHRLRKRLHWLRRSRLIF